VLLQEFQPPRFTARYVTGVELEGPECRFQHCLGLDTFSALPGTLSTECVDQAGFLWRQGDNLIFPLDNSEFQAADYDDYAGADERRSSTRPQAGDCVCLL
jgi:hypothetical protein